MTTPPPRRWADAAVWWHVYPLGFTGAEPRSEPRGHGADGGAGDDGGGGDDATVHHRLGHLEAWLDHAVDLGVTGLLLGPVFASETHGYDTVDHLRIDPRLGDDGDFDRLVAALRRRGLRLLLDGVFNHVGRGFPGVADVAARGDAAPRARWFRRVPGEDGAPDFATFEGHHRLVALNHLEPAVADHVVTVMDHWLDRGADGWRLDAAYAVPPVFWRTVLPRVRERHPDAWFVGEVIHGDYPAIVERGTLDSVTQYELWKAIWSSLNDANLFELAWALERHNGFVEAFTPLTFVGNHDVTRIASRLRSPALLPHALVVLLTVGGAPAIYAGDERGWRGVKEEREGGDDAVRPAFPATPADLPPDGRDIEDLHRLLIGVRRQRPWLARARTGVAHLANETMAYTAAAGGGHRLGVVLNIGAGPATVPSPVPGGRVVAGAGVASVAGGSGAEVTVDAHGWAVLAADGDADADGDQG